MGFSLAISYYHLLLSTACVQNDEITGMKLQICESAYYAGVQMGDLPCPTFDKCK